MGVLEEQICISIKFWHNPNSEWQFLLTYLLYFLFLMPFFKVLKNSELKYKFFEKSWCTQNQNFWTFCPINSNMTMKNFRGIGFLCFGTSCMDIPKPWGSRKKIFMIIFEFFGQFYFQNDVFKLQDILLWGDLSIPWNELESFQTFLILQIWDKPEVLKIF
jgi:hypothetical protein